MDLQVHKNRAKKTLTRHKASESSLATRVAYHSIGLDALGANVQMPRCALYNGTNSLNVRIETTLVTPVRVRHAHPESGTFSTYIAYRSHVVTSDFL